MNKHKQGFKTWYSVNSISRSICRSKPFIPYKQRRSFSILKQLYREQIVFFDTIKRQIPKHTVSGFILRFTRLTSLTFCNIHIYYCWHCLLHHFNHNQPIHHCWPNNIFFSILPEIATEARTWICHCVDHTG